MKNLFLTLFTLSLVNMSATAQIEQYNQRPNGDHYLTPDSYGNPIPLDVYQIDINGGLTYVYYNSMSRMDSYIDGGYFLDIAQPCYSDTLLTIVGVSGFFGHRFYNNMNGYIHIADTDFHVYRTLRIPKEEYQGLYVYDFPDRDKNYTEMFFEQPINVKGKFLVIWDNPKPDVANAEYEYDYGYSTRDSSYADLLAHSTDTSITRDYLPYIRFCNNDSLFSWRKYDNTIPFGARFIYNPCAVFYLFPIFGELDTTIECVGCETNIDTIDASIRSNGIVEMYTHIFPNPVKEELNVQSSFKIEDIEVYNSLSQKVFSQQVYGYNASINTSSFEKGVYILRIKTQSGVVNKKFIVE